MSKKKTTTLKLSCGDCGSPSTGCSDWCKPRNEAVKKKNDGSSYYPNLEAMIKRLEERMHDVGFITEYDIIDEISRLEYGDSTDHIPVVQELLDLVVESVHPVDAESAILLGKATNLMSENFIKLASAGDRLIKPGEVSRYLKDARRMQKVSAEHFMHAGVLSISKVVR